jgi:hypothetical protein
MALGGEVDITARQRRAAALAVVFVLPLFTYGCGGGEERTSNLRPPTPINLSVKIGDDRVSASPTRFGAGPVVVVASNQSSASHTLTIEGPRLKQSVGPINPQDTATLRVSVNPGEYTISTESSASVKPARLTVGPKRPSAQNKLLQP